MGLTSLLGSLLNMIDTVMIEGISEEAIVAVGSANKLFFLMMVTLFGVYSGFGVFISQYWGKKDLKRLQTVYMMAIISGLVISIVASLVAIFIPSQIIGFFSKDAIVIGLGVKYLKIIAFSYILSALIFSVEMVSRSTENVKLPLVVSIFGIITNTVLNLILIFGLNLSFKIFNLDINISTIGMGVEGAAIATLISRIFQLVIYLLYIFITKNTVLYLKISNFVYDMDLLKKIFKKSLPVVGNEFLWSLGIITIFAAYKTLGTQASASIQLFDTLVGLLTVFTWGVANSSAIMIGKKIGENNIKEAKWYASLFIVNSILIGILTGILICASIPFIHILYSNISYTVLNNIRNLLVIIVFFMPFKLLAGTFIVGILRSGGDTLFAFLVEGVCLWFYAVPIAFLLVEFTALSLPIIYLIISLEEVIKDILCFIRYKSGKYIHNLVH